MNKVYRLLFIVLVSHKSLRGMDLSRSSENSSAMSEMKLIETCDAAGKQLIKAIVEENEAQIEQLLSQEVNLNQFDVHQSDHCTTPLIAAAYRGNPVIVEILLGLGADPNFEHNILGLPPLRHSALTAAIASRKLWAKDIMLLLMRARADTFRPSSCPSEEGSAIVLAGNWDAETPERPHMYYHSYPVIFHALFHTTREQKKCFIAFMCSLKRLGVVRDIRGLLKNCWLKINKTEKAMHSFKEISRIENDVVKARLVAVPWWHCINGIWKLDKPFRDNLELYKFLAHDLNVRFCWSSGCTFAYSIDANISLSWLDRLRISILGEPTMTCPICNKPIVINQPKFPAVGTCMTESLNAIVKASTQDLQYRADIFP